MKNILRKSLLAIPLLALTGCLYPAKDTYYEISSTTPGKLLPSGCTYPGNRKDAVYRELESLSFSVVTDSLSDKQISITLFVSSKNHDIKINANQLQIVLGMNKSYIEPSSFSSGGYDSGNSNDKLPIKSWVGTTYPVTIEEIEEFKLIFNSSAILQEGKPVNIDPIQFNRVTKTGLYAIAINC